MSDIEVFRRIHLQRCIGDAAKSEIYSTNPSSKNGAGKNEGWTDHPETGQAMLIAISVMAVLILIPLVVFSSASNRVPLTIELDNQQASLAAVRSGLSEYMARVQANPYYPAECNEGDNYTYTTSQGTQVCNQNSGSSAFNPAFSRWVQIPSSTNEYYTYRVLYQQSPLQEVVIVVGCAGLLFPAPTGSPPTTTATCGTNSQSNTTALAQQLGPFSIFEYPYFTKHNITDPADPNLYSTITGSTSALTYNGNDYTNAVISSIKSQIIPSNSVPYNQVSPAGQIDQHGCVVLGSQQNPVNVTNGTNNQSGTPYGPIFSTPPLGNSGVTNWTSAPVTVNINGTSYGVVCAPAYFQNELVNGSHGVSSDDTFYYCGNPNFTGSVHTYSVKTPDNSSGTGWIQLSNPVWYLWYQNSSNCGYTLPSSMDPAQAMAYQELPHETNFESAAIADGCYYTGQTSIVFTGTTMAVSSPNSTAGTASGDTNPNCLGQNASLPANGIIYVAPGGSGYQALGPPPPPGYGPPSYTVGCSVSNLSCSAGFSGTWEPGAPNLASGSSSYNNSAYNGNGNSGGLYWETNDPATSGDLFVQGTLQNSVTMVASNNVYLTGSVCISGDTGCTNTNYYCSADTSNCTGGNVQDQGQGNSLSGYYASPSNIPANSNVYIGIAAGNMVKAYNPVENSQNNLGGAPPYQPGFNAWPSLNVICQPSWFLLCYQQLSVTATWSFSGPTNYETSLEGYPHKYITVDGVLLTLKGGLTVQQIAFAGGAGSTYNLMADPSFWDHIDAPYPPLATFNTNGAVVEDFAPNMDCNVNDNWLFALFGATTGCGTPTDLEIPFICVDVLGIVWPGGCNNTGGKPSASGTSATNTCAGTQNSAPTSGNGWWGYNDVTGLGVGYSWYQWVISTSQGYTPCYNHDSRLNSILPNGFPPPIITVQSTSQIDPSTVTNIGGGSLSNSSLW
ncbi:MAG: hypothetical protein M1483_00535 [Actinobacteria bacterium]|nr:hypothetical protein [Actinomycetota bacterium]MCL6104120.1 hypothetical protein [Actinomycetota bacterium]